MANAEERFGRCKDLLSKLESLNGINQNEGAFLTKSDANYFESKTMEIFCELNEWYNDTLKEVRKPKKYYFHNVETDELFKVADCDLEELELYIEDKLIPLSQNDYRALWIKKNSEKPAKEQRITRSCCGMEFHWTHQCAKCGSLDEEWNNVVN